MSVEAAAKVIPIFCDDCVSVKHYDAARAYVNVRLCRKHAATSEALHQARQACEAALGWFDNEMEVGYSEEMKAVADQLRQVVQEGK